ncbi:hypothetical protein LUZ60_008567 [Juncus effusus]|nr:hypothetical protein LUZ60_008567 [Juncus effusus]
MVVSTTTGSIGGHGPATATTAVAIDKDKNSQSAVRWAVENLTTTSNSLILVHVVNKNALNNGFSTTDVGGGAAREFLEAEMMNLFLSYKGLCARRRVQIVEVVLEDTDIAKALINFINTKNIENIVLGASRSSFFKSLKLKTPDVPTRVMNSAPEFCAVYVISKAKLHTVRSAKNVAPASANPPRLPPIHTPSPQIIDPPRHPGSFHGADHGDSVKIPFGRAPLRGPIPAHVQGFPERRSFERNAHDTWQASKERPLTGARTMPTNVLQDASDLGFKRRAASHESVNEDLDFHGGSSSSIGFTSMDFTDQSHDFSSTITDSSHGTNSPCGAAEELTQEKMESNKIVDEAKQAQEAAIRIAESEKAKTKAALESAEMARRIAELEAQKRHSAELKAKRESEEKRKALNALAHNDVRYRRYSIDEIDIATNHFNETMKIGEGGYGPVYRASLNHTPVAIKVLRPDAAQGRKQFQQEVQVLSCIRHPNMVLLLGACPEYGCLVYEYMDNGSLEDRLFRRSNTPTIPWSIRFKIAAEIATALLFLHQAKPEPLVHRDLKPANILLDRNYTSKISDVGLSRLVPPSVADSVTQYRMTSTAGTFCYIDPEYQQTGMLGIKSDIYSLGVLLLQLVTAKPPMGLTHHVERALDKGTFEQLMDPTVTDWPIEEVLGYAKLALKCTELRRKDRPDLGTVILPELNRLRNLGISYEAGVSISRYQDDRTELRIRIWKASFGLKSIDTNKEKSLILEFVKFVPNGA